MARLIDADALIKAMRGKFIDHIEEHIAITIIRNAPTIDAVSEVHGEWMEREVFYNSDDMIEKWQSARCSVCNKYHTTPYMYYFDNFNFCPNCGADMRKESK